MHTWRTIFACAVLPAAIIVLQAKTVATTSTLQGRVARILDGDTVDLLVGGSRTERIRLAGIDAPERGQPFGTQARKHLASLCFLRDVTVQANKRDRYGRLLGRILADREDLNRRMIQDGFAWHYLQYAHEQHVDERAGDASAEREAHTARRGLWAEVSPVPPWDWRKRGRRR